MVKRLSESQRSCVVSIDPHRVSHARDETGVGAAEPDFMCQSLLGRGECAEFEMVYSVS